MLEALPRPSYELPGDLGAVSLASNPREDKALLDALEDLNDTARHHGRYLVFAIDEIQDAPVDGLRDGARATRA